MNWKEFADDTDVRANELYQDLVNAKADGDYNQYSGWVRVPAKLGFVNYTDGIHKGDVSVWWNGFDHVPVIHYWTSNDELYIRLPLHGEIAE